MDNPIATHTGFADVTPPAPVLDEFDNAVLQMCGGPGKKTSREEFINLMTQNPDLLRRLMDFTGGKVRDGVPAPDKETYLRQLADVWYKRHGFDHIFCGEKNGNKVDGLHFHGRYLQLQNQNMLCRLDGSQDRAKNEVSPGLIYTIGVRMKFGDSESKHNTKGYAYTLSASDILLGASRAFAENPTSGTGNAACLLALKDGANLYSIVFVRTSEGLVTFYADATPTGQSCSRTINLP